MVHNAEEDNGNVTSFGVGLGLWLGLGLGLGYSLEPLFCPGNEGLLMLLRFQMLDT